MPGTLKSAVVAAACAACSAFLSAAVAAVFPVGAETIVDGLSAPTDIVVAADHSNRLFVVEQTGGIRIVRNGGLVPAPFLDIGSLLIAGGEQGLLGLAFHPQYATNGRFFVNYTRAGDGATVIASYRVSSADPDRADALSRSELLIVPQPFSNHNGGALRFGPDGYLYIGMGDGGGGNDPGNRAQDPQELLGKLLRIDVDGGDPYAIPPGNPFAAGGGRPEIFASGLRNPWRVSFDRTTGDIYIGDVGQHTQEEIDFVPGGQGAGANFGWRVMEGIQCTGLGGGPPCGSPTLTPPILTYGHDEGCSVTGGVVYRGRNVPVLYGRYLYGDFCSGRLWAAGRDAEGRWRADVIMETGHALSGFGEDAEGEVYWADLSAGRIHRLTADASAPLAIEYYNAALQHYFLTAESLEAAALDGGAFGGAWKRTGYAFAVSTSTGSDSFDVCRFFGKPGEGPDSHFYTGYEAECATLKANPLWIFESVGFRMALPSGNSCPASTLPVYRLYNDPATLAAVNHRFTTDASIYAQLQGAGWIGEGVAFCAR